MKFPSKACDASVGNILVSRCCRCATLSVYSVEDNRRELEQQAELRWLTTPSRHWQPLERMHKRTYTHTACRNGWILLLYLVITLHRATLVLRQWYYRVSLQHEGAGTRKTSFLNLLWCFVVLFSTKLKPRLHTDANTDIMWPTCSSTHTHLILWRYKEYIINISGTTRSTSLKVKTLQCCPSSTSVYLELKIFITGLPRAHGKQFDIHYNFA